MSIHQSQSEIVPANAAHQPPFDGTREADAAPAKRPWRMPRLEALHIRETATAGDTNDDSTLNFS